MNDGGRRSRGRGLGAGALISAAVAVHPDVTRENDVTRYRRARYDLLREQLGVEWDLNDPRTPRRRFPSDVQFLVGLFVRTIGLLRQSNNPFAGILEAPAAIIAAHDRHGERLGRASREVWDAQRALALDLLLLLEPDLATRTTTEDALRAVGPPEDPASFGDDY